MDDLRLALRLGYRLLHAFISDILAGQPCCSEVKPLPDVIEEAA